MVMLWCVLHIFVLQSKFCWIFGLIFKDKPPRKFRCCLFANRGEQLLQPHYKLQIEVTITIGVAMKTACFKPNGSWPLVTTSSSFSSTFSSSAVATVLIICHISVVKASTSTTRSMSHVTLNEVQTERKAQSSVRAPSAHEIRIAVQALGFVGLGRLHCQGCPWVEKFFMGSSWSPIACSSRMMTMFQNRFPKTQKVGIMYQTGFRLSAQLFRNSLYKLYKFCKFHILICTDYTNISSESNNFLALISFIAVLTYYWSTTHHPYPTTFSDHTGPQQHWA